jgi:hypothetical protein
MSSDRATFCDNRLWRSRFSAFSFRLTLSVQRKSFRGPRLHFVGTAGGPSFSDIIREFCRSPLATRPGNPVELALGRRQKGTAFCFVLFHNRYSNNRLMTDEMLIGPGVTCEGDSCAQGDWLSAVKTIEFFAKMTSFSEDDTFLHPLKGHFRTG